MFCNYYHITTTSRNVMILTALLKSIDNVAFHRTIEGTSNVIEFFVPVDQQKRFDDLLSWYKSCNLEFTITQHPNRLA